MNSMINGLNKYKSMSIQARASIWYSGCSILQKGISFFVIPIYTRLLTTAQYGRYTIFQSWRDLIVIFATLNLYCGVFTKAMVDYEDDRDRYTSSMQGLSTVITTIVLVIYLVAMDKWNTILNIDKVTMILLIAYYYVYPAFSFWSVRQRVEYKYKIMVGVTLLVAIFTPVLSIFLLIITPLRSEAVIWGFLYIQIVVGLYFYVSNFLKGRVFYNKTYWIHALKFNIPLIPHYLSLIVLGQADRIMIGSMCGADKAGIYGLAYSVSQLMIIFISSINNSLVPWMYEKLKKQEYVSIASVSDLLCVFCCLMTLGAILISPEIIMILGGKSYIEAKWVVPIVSLSVYYTFCYGLFANVEFYFDATKYVMIASTIGAITNVVLNSIMIPIFGYIAAAYTTLMCYALFMLMHYVFMRRICDKEINGIKIFDNNFIFMSSLGMFIVMLVCVILYNYLIIRYCVIIVLVFLVVIFRDKVKSVIYSLKG